MKHTALLFNGRFGVQCVCMVGRGVEGDLVSSRFLFRILWLTVCSLSSARVIHGLRVPGNGVVSEYRLVLRRKLIGYGAGGRSGFV